MLHYVASCAIPVLDASGDLHEVVHVCSDLCHRIYSEKHALPYRLAPVHEVEYEDEPPMCEECGRFLENLR